MGHFTPASLQCRCDRLFNRRILMVLAGWLVLNLGWYGSYPPCSVVVDS